MEDPIDVSYYIGVQSAETLGNLDVPLNNGQIVSINLIDELPDDPNELIGFLQGEKCACQYWISVASAYARLNKLNEAMEIINATNGLSQFNDEDKKSFQSFQIWLYFKYISLGIDKETNLIQVSSEINNLSQKIKTDNTTNAANSTSNILSQAVLFLYQGRDDDALDIFDRILRIDQNNCFALLGKAQAILNKTKNYSLALKLYQQVLILNPMMKPDPRLGIGLCFWFLKDDRMAFQSWERSLELDDHNLKAKIFLNLAKFHQTFNNSLTDEEFLDNYKLCLTELSKLNKSNPNDSIILLPLASYYFSKGDYELVEKLIKKVVKNITGYESLIKFNSFNRVSKYESNVLSQCATWFGRIQFANNDFTQASKYFQEAIKLKDTNIVAKLGLGQSQYNRGSIEEAIMTFESILRSNVKCLEVNYSLGLLYSKQKSKRKQDMAIQILERYIRLSNNRGLASSNKDDIEFMLNKEPVTLNAYLVLSKLYESTDINQSLNYLNKAIESRKHIGKDVPLEIYNNIGVFNFMKQNYDESSKNFQTALDKVESNEFKSDDGDLLIDLPQDLKVSLNFNLARSKEISNVSEALEIYETLLQECPHYFSAKLRILFLNCISDRGMTKEEIKTEIEELLNSNASDLEIRSFYGWFAKNFGKRLGLQADADTKHQKDTLVEYDSHDCYALISLANIYCIMARDTKGSNDDQKKKQQKYYMRGIELFTKVLSLDSKNVYAAQGLAISYIENKEPNKGLDILRKIRDSLNDISVYLNLGHVLCELKQFGKGIENYELALGRFTDGKDSKILSFLGRAWYLRAHSEKNLGFYKRALEYTRLALDSVKGGSKASIRFNIAYVNFQIAEFITKQSISQRNVEDIENAINGLKDAIEILNELSSDEEKHPPYPKEELKSRANLGTNTLLNRLTTALQETRESLAEVEHKLEIAKQVMKEEEEAKLKEEEAKLAALAEKEKLLAQERAALQEQAQQWAEEQRSNIVDEGGDEEDDDLFNEESKSKKDKKRKATAPTKGGPKKKKKKRAKKGIVDDSEEESARSSGESDVENDNESKTTSPKKKKKVLSNEFINDSDDDLDDDDLFGENDEEEEDKQDESNGKANGADEDDEDED
ncbi:CTR9 [[Candida] subhashii]|uniref:CTR9 n=1 Tax=[Candida] subhashii TaxID=561895 RepID=A0A8J5QD54_9ASCO|nr:CTR9 [[Candida] subhashii]KAG7660583.1 CTR9 [[Candida] subhashii]